jgi:hypothetical protein
MRRTVGLDKAGVIAGYSSCSLQSDPSSGLVQREEFLWLLYAGSVVHTPTATLNIGYSIGNDSYDGNNNRLLFIYYGVTF